KELFSSTRQKRETGLMKPSELRAFRVLPDTLTVYRAHRPGETDWIAYTLDAETAARFTVERGVSEVTAYEVDKIDVLALFLRRGESEVLILDRTRPRLMRRIEVVVAED